MLQDANEAAAEGATSDKAPEVAAPEAWVSHLGGTVGRLARSEAPGLEASEARAGGPEAGAEEPSRPDAPEVTTPEAPTNALGANGRAPGFGQLRLDFEALRKRKGSPSCSDDAYRPLKQRKYIAMDE